MNILKKIVTSQFIVSSLMIHIVTKTRSMSPPERKNVSKHLENDPVELEKYYRAIHLMRSHFENVRKDHNTKNDSIVISGFESWPTPNNYHDRTKNRILLHGDNFFVDRLWTPFGYVNLFGAGFVHEEIAISKVFMETMDWDIEEVKSGSPKLDHFRWFNIFSGDELDETPKRGIGKDEKVYIVKRVGDVVLVDDRNEDDDVVIYSTCYVDEGQTDYDRKMFDFLSKGENIF